MNDLIFGIHMAMVAMEVFYLVMLNIKVKHTEKTGLVLHLACSLIYIYAFAQLQTATSFQEAILANKIEYIGSTFSALSFLLFIKEYLDLKVPKAIGITCVIGNMAVLLSILNLENNTLFYSYVNYIEINGTVVLQKGHGFLYYAFILFTIFLDAFCVGLIASYYTSQKRTFSAECITMMVGVAFPVLMFVLYLFDMGYDLVSYGYFLSDTILVWMVSSKKIFDVMHSSRESIYNNLKEGFILIDQSEIVRDHNLTMEKIIGHSIENGAFVKDIYWGDLGITPGTYEYKKHIYEVTVQPVNYKKRTLGSLITFSDITQHREEVRRQEYFANKARSADEAKTKFLMNVSHRLRTPLNTIMGYNDDIFETTESEEIKKNSEKIKEASVEFLGLIDDILSMANEKSTDALDDLLKKPNLADKAVKELEFKNVNPAVLGVNIKRRVLIVDDTESNCIVLQLMLKKNGIEADVVYNGNDALDICDKKHYSLIIMDYMMPEMDGIKTFNELRKRVTGLNANVPVILYSADVTGGIKQKAIDAGFVSYLSKPVNKELMLAEYEFWTNTYNFNMKKGLELCDDDEEIYAEIISAFYDEWNDKLKYIDEIFVSGNMEKYRVLMHGVKSAALYIGGQEISDLAKAQEFAVKEGRMDFVKEHHEEFMQRLEVFLKCINNIEVE